MVLNELIWFRDMELTAWWKKKQTWIPLNQKFSNDIA